MTRHQREALRAAVDAHTREVLAADDGHWNRCRGCGCWQHDWVLGCTTCNDRHTRWAREHRHPDPQYFQMRYAEVRAWSETASMRRKRWGADPTRALQSAA